MGKSQESQSHSQRSKQTVELLTDQNGDISDLLLSQCAQRKGVTFTNGEGDITDMLHEQTQNE